MTEAPNKRVKHFDEYTPLLTEAQAAEEAQRMLKEDLPACVFGTDCKAILELTAKKKFDEAAAVLRSINPFPEISSRICSYRRFCSSDDIFAFNAVERFLAARNIKVEQQKKQKYRVAVVGSGPAGLACAKKLAEQGIQVTIIDALTTFGGVLRQRIPGFRLPAKILDNAVKELESLGVIFKPGVIVGRSCTIDDLAKQYDALFIATGASIPHIMDMPGIDLNEVFVGNEFLSIVNRKKNPAKALKQAKHTVIIGGGETALDCARVARRLGSDATLVYRRAESDMPVCQTSVQHAKEEGVQYLLLTNPVRILGSESVEGVECVQMMLGEEDFDGKRAPECMEGTEFTLNCDRVIISIGQDVSPLIAEGSSIRTIRRGLIHTNQNMQTSIANVFAGGSAVYGPRPFAFSIRDGVVAAAKIKQFLNGELEQLEEELYV